MAGRLLRNFILPARGYIERGGRSLADDAQAQTEWLNREAKMRGFQDIDALAESRPEVFAKLAAKWREQNPADALMARGEDAYAAAVRRWRQAIAGVKSLAQSVDMPTPTVFTALGFKASKLSLPARYLQGIIEKHRDIPDRVLYDLPELLSDPIVAIPHTNGGYRVLLDVRTTKGEPIVAGIGMDGRVQTVTPIHDGPMELGAERIAGMLDAALSQEGVKVYARNKEALNGVRASRGAAMGTRSPNHPTSTGAVPATIALHRTPRDKAIVLYRSNVVKSKGEFGPGIRLSRRSDTDTIDVDGVQRLRTNSDGQPIAATDVAISNFWHWFDKSKVVDAQGRPLVVYHGTTADFSEFDPDRAGQNFDEPDEVGMLFSSGTAEPELMADREKSGGNILPVYLSLQNPLIVDVDPEMAVRRFGGVSATSWYDNNKANIVKRAERGGHDGIIVRAPAYKGAKGHQTIVAFSPEQIKSATGNRGTFDAASPDIRFSRAERPASQDRVRSLGHTGPVLSEFRNDQPLKANPNYQAAKGGDLAAAAQFAQDLVKPELIERARKEFGSDVVYLPVRAEEASGRNKIPLAVAEYLSVRTGAGIDTDIVQSGRAYHTGAKAMERLLARAEFDGDVQTGKRYVLVDDVTTMGSTLADLAHYIRSQGGEVAGSVVLTNAMREPTMEAGSRVIKELEARHGQAIRDILGVEPGALTASEAQYLIGFRTTDELRNRVAAARHERGARLLSKGVSPSGQEGGVALSRAQPATQAQAAAQDAAERAQQIIDTPAATPAPFERVAQTISRATGLEWAARQAYDRGAQLLDLITPERVKAGMVSDYGVPEAVIDRRAELTGRQRAQLREAGSLVEKLSTLTRGSIAKRSTASRSARRRVTCDRLLECAWGSTFARQCCSVRDPPQPTWPAVMRR